MTINKEAFVKFGSEYNILEIIGYEDYKIKIWAMWHMNEKKEIDVEEWGGLNCKSFFNKGIDHARIIDIIETLVESGIFYTPDERAHIKQYKFRGQPNIEFNKLVNGAINSINENDHSETTKLFRDSLLDEDETSFIEGNQLEYFSQLKNNNIRIKEFFIKFLNTNASALVEFIFKLIYNSQNWGF